MLDQLVLSLHADVRCHQQADDTIVLASPSGSVPLDSLTPGLRAALLRLAQGGATRDDLARLVHAHDGPDGIPGLYVRLARWGARGLFRYSVLANGRPYLTVEPLAAGWQPGRTALAQTDPVRLSRFAAWRRDGDHLVVESPLAPARILLADPSAAALLAQLVKPMSAVAVAALLPTSDVETALGLLGLLLDAGVLGQVRPDGAVDDEVDPVLAQWEPLDLQFHTRTRTARHVEQFGPTFRFLGRIPPLPAVKPLPEGPRIALFRPDIAHLRTADPPLTAVLEDRRSLRAYGEPPIHVDQLGELLFRVGRVRRLQPYDDTSGARYETTDRPYPSGGAAYELELYLAVARCAGIEPGVYAYDPLGHQLIGVAGPSPALDTIMSEAAEAARLTSDPQVLLVCTSRFPRTSWKYQGGAYALTLKHVGVLYQSLYLVATALGLAPCALGGGDAHRLAEVAGLDFYAESAVGEFLLGSARGTTSPAGA